MPTLDGEAKSRYLDAYGPAAYEAYRNDNGVDTFHGSKYTSSKGIKRAFVHRPDHDMESIFWVLLSVLLTVEPKEPSKDSNLDVQYNAMARAYFDEHTIQKGALSDSRDPLLEWDTSYLEYVLDPRFHTFAPMLHEMGRQVIPEYAYLDKEPPKDHLHEAMRRILLRYISEMKDKIDLVPEKESWQEEEQGQQGHRGSKRKAPDAGGRNKPTKKSRSVAEDHQQRRLSSQTIPSYPTATSRGATRSQRSNGKSTRGGTSKASTRGSQRRSKSVQTKSRR